MQIWIKNTVFWEYNILYPYCPAVFQSFKPFLRLLNGHLEIETKTVVGRELRDGTGNYYTKNLPPTLAAHLNAHDCSYFLACKTQ